MKYHGIFDCYMKP